MQNPGLDNKNIKFNNPIWGIPTLLRNTEDKPNNKEDNTKMSFSVDTFNTNVIPKISKNINSGESNLKTTEVINKSNNINLNNLSYTLNLPNNRINISDISIKINEDICPYIIPSYSTQYNTKNKNLSYIVLNNYYNISLNPILTQIKPAIIYYGDYPVVVGRANIGNPLNIKNNIQENSKLNNTIKINKNKDSNNFKKFKIFNKIKAKKDSETYVISVQVVNKVISLVLKFKPKKSIK